MEDLKCETTILAGARVRTVSARTLHARLGLSTHFPVWWGAVRRARSFQEGVDYITWDEDTKLPGRPERDADVALDAAVQVAVHSRRPESRELLVDLMKAHGSAPATPSGVYGLPFDESQIWVRLDRDEQVEIAKAMTKDIRDMVTSQAGPLFSLSIARRAAEELDVF